MVDIFGAAQGLLGGWGGEQKGPPPWNLWHISYSDETSHSYTLPTEDPKNIWITWHTLSVLLKSALFNQKSANFLISRNTDIDCLLMKAFLKQCYFEIKVTRRHNSCPWCHQQIFIMWFKLYCRRGHVTKVW